MINKNTERMERMLDEMEHFLENAQRNVQAHTLNGREAIEDLLSQQRSEVESAGVSFITSVEYLAPCSCDRSRISVILSNLVRNAVQFRDECKPVSVINVSFKVTRNKTVLTVADNGIGIDSEFHERIFDLFFRASPRSNGAGIGLYVVKQAIEKMNATITVESIPDSGSTFTVTIPNPKKNPIL
jgi:signal transduction histidine kinase